ncbi:hypothetical protein U6A24_08760 [Aquimarina gracilis]|uniref:Uncharacterized protein n=1 Tax=Aquimarina gracilis TaxID=874422 RepID=A0ABU5ZVD7_9FLAO|nr:hypothetical protein [Aquimarina gracilis]MEB3345547.1 hypothetical protein [Aquimarina gracilis]
MNGEKLLKFLISFFVIGQVLGFVLESVFLSAYSGVILIGLLMLSYIVGTKKVRVFHLVVLLLLFFGGLFEFFNGENNLRSLIVIRISVFVLLFYFLYYNHKSFVYNSRDIFTLILGTLLYTVIFFMIYKALKDGMGDLHLLGFLHLLLLYVLVIIGAMYYINKVRKIVMVFLSMLNFAFGDYM